MRNGFIKLDAKPVALDQRTTFYPVILFFPPCVQRVAKSFLQLRPKNNPWLASKLANQDYENPRPNFLITQSIPQAD